MAKYDSGILGPFNGKLGNVVGSNWKGIDYMRSIGRRRRTKPPSPKQQVQMARFAFVAKFIKSMTALFKVTFKDYANDITEHNYVTRYTISNVLTGSYPNFAFNYSSSLVAQGSLPNVGNPSASNGGPGEIRWNWTDNSNNGLAKAEDKAILVAYCEELNQCEFKLPGTMRQAAVDSLQVNAFSGKQVQTWISFIAEDGNIATSIYTGAVNVN
jgi:hypothetical protein